MTFAPDNDKRVEGSRRREQGALKRHAGRRADQTSVPGQGYYFVRRVSQCAGNLEGRSYSGSVEQLEVGIKQKTDPYGHVLK
ncbi:hypothetical protein GRO01_08710 [Gluconobacter roseus NBRC 3990]|uniref:Uncharacterized protein n=1 Tax=Gluconobacter roseus NBRC 3990 TaxID=1307950 RepID=A0A4Y3M3R8_9PROT|nr:hypothetical protein GRO01_08710 [Gluconobacter roseus NBRC 3990]GLP93753.1 hypothetical protein GCM10007871_17310 [Gluconobacter roseus NBRC 3990]